MSSAGALGAAPASAPSLAAAGGGGAGRSAREPTTNAHDWVWLGRATLERATGHGPHHHHHPHHQQQQFHHNNNNNNMHQQQQYGKEMRITANPMMAPGAALGNCFDNPTHIDLPPSNPAPIDTATYCKKDKQQQPPPPVPRHKGVEACADPGADAGADGPAYTDAALWQITAPPPPLPPHGLPLSPPQPSEADLVVARAGTGSGEEYKPPVPPHRNIGVTARIGPSRLPAASQQQQQQVQQLLAAAAAAAAAAATTNTASSGGVGGSGGGSSGGTSPHSPAPPRRHHHHHHHHHHHRTTSGATAAASVATAATAAAGGGHRRHTPKPPDLVADGPCAPPPPQALPPPVPRHHKPRAPKEASPPPPPPPSTGASDAAPSTAQLSPSFVEYPPNSMMGAARSGQRRGNSPEVKRATIVGNPMFSAMEGAGNLADDFRPKEDLLGLDDFNLTMDYDQLVEYFDNLKESNA